MPQKLSPNATASTCSTPFDPKTSTKPLIPLTPRNIVASGLCIGCGSCVAQADQESGAHMELDDYGHFKPHGAARWLNREAESFARTCPFSPVAANENDLAAALFPDAKHCDEKVGRFQTAYVGYVAEGDFRARGSSGGMVSWVAEELLRAGLVDGVLHVVPVVDPQSHNRFFRYRIARSESEIRQGAKSRYYPVELSEMLRLVRETPGRYAVVGVPCFIKALQLLRREEPILRERIAFTLGLFCGHMKSARFVESFAWQMEVPITEVHAVEFRLKDPTRAASTYTAQLRLRDGTTVQRDWWNLADGDWGAGFFQNSACNWCDDVVAETADISFGDAWVEPYSSDGRGTNVVVVRSPLVQQLMDAAIEAGRLQLETVDSDFIAQTQAAGFRQRREGLAYRLYLRRRSAPHVIQPRKRVAPAATVIPLRRKLIYLMRAFITASSHRVFHTARVLRRPRIYVRWAHWSLAVYHGLAYGRGKVGEWAERLGWR